MCCGLQIIPVEEQLKQRVIGERYCISRKKEVIQKNYEPFSAFSLSVICLVKNEKLSSPSELSSASMFKLDESIFGVWWDMSP